MLTEARHSEHEAATAVPTVYASTGGKSAILATLIDQAERDPIVEVTFAAIRESRTPHEVIQVTAHASGWTTSATTT